MNKKLIVLTIIFSWLFVLTVIGQDTKLANEYYHTGEYDKAAMLYKKLSEKTRNNEYYFNRYIESLLALEEYDEVEKSIKKQIKANPKNVHLYVQLGNMHERKGALNKAEDQYEKAIKNISPNRNIITSLANSFLRLTKYEQAERTYLLGSAMMENDMIFAGQLADIYRRQGEDQKMIKYYLLSINQNPNGAASIKNLFSRYLTDEQYDELTVQLYESLQEHPENVQYPELLEWVFVQQKQYDKALRQAKSLDRRLEGNGSRVYNLALIAVNDKDYDTAISAYKYITEEKGSTSSYYNDAQQAILKTKKKQVLNSANYTKEELEELKIAYIQYLDQVGKNNKSASIILELAILEAYYLQDIDAGITLLNELVKQPGLNKYTKANSKLQLGDLYLIKDEIWESTLLYSQVDKEFREDYLGELARFKNAKLSYFNGDFGWAQTQFDILKASTSKLISNDAIDIAVFITDNMGLDTTDIPLKLYAATELLTFQNRYDDALQKLSELATNYKEHTLLDDIFYAKAHIFVRRQEYDQAIEMYEKIIANHPEEIRCDNALIELARLYDFKLTDVNKASELYEKLFIDYSNSTFALEARKRFRALRGDDI